MDVGLFDVPYFYIRQLTGVISITQLITGDDLAEVQGVLWEAKLKWYNIGLRLKMKSHELDAIDQEAGDDTGKKLTQMIKSRLNMAEPCTWKDLYEALKHQTVCMQDVADKLKKLKQKGKHYVLVYNTDIDTLNPQWACTGGL